MDASNKQLAASSPNALNVSASQVGGVAGFNGPLHPLVERGQWAIDVDFDRLLPTLRLVSAVLRCEESDRFFRTLFFGQLTSSKVLRPGRWFRYVPLIKSAKPYDQITAPEREQVQGKLRSMAPLVSFHIVNTLPVHAGGYCWGRPAQCQSLESFKKRSNIEIRQDTYANLGPHECSRMSSASMKKRQVCLASTILHELAHAAAFAALGVGNLFFEDMAACETGFDYISHIFGACPQMHGDEAAHWSQWPSQARVDVYKPRLPCKDYSSLIKSRKWMMVDSDAELLMDSQTWDHKVPTLGHHVVVPKILDSCVRSYLRHELTDSPVPSPVPNAILEVYRRR